MTLKGTPGAHRKYRPYAFTEQGVAMLSSVLRSPRAVQVNIAIMRAFVRLRRMLESNEELARKLDALERRHDAQFKIVFDAIRELMQPVEPERRRIGFKAELSRPPSPEGRGGQGVRTTGSGGGREPLNRSTAQPPHKLNQ